jgi:hypothetical protein
MPGPTAMNTLTVAELTMDYATCHFAAPVRFAI